MQVGDKVLAEVEEIVGPLHLIVAIEGRLYRIRNETDRKYRRGEKLFLKVKSSSPVSFQVIN